MIAKIRRYSDIKDLAAETGRRIPDLLAMASQNDPFYIMPAQQKQGEWFAALWERFDFPAGVHLRRIHYVQPVPAAWRPVGARCARRWRPLRDPESVRLGIGPECRKGDGR